MKTVKVLHIDLGMISTTCIKHLEDKSNPFWLYAEWYDGKPHSKLIAKYADMVSVLCHITNYLRNG